MSHHDASPSALLAYGLLTVCLVILVAADTVWTLLRPRRL